MLQILVHLCSIQTALFDEYSQKIQPHNYEYPVFHNNQFSNNNITYKAAQVQEAQLSKVMAGCMLCKLSSLQLTV